MSGELTVKSALLQANDLDLLDAQILLAHVLKVGRSFLYSHDERVLTSSEQQQWALLLSRRKEGVPVAYLVGEKECMGLLFEVTPDVLIPRPDTECLIETALSLLPVNANVLDIGTGSGVIACSIAYFKPDCGVVAVDISMDALNVAQRNIDRHQLKNVSVVQSDVFSNIHDSFDIIISNPPYIAATDPYLSGDIRFEPQLALIAEESGLLMLRRIIDGAMLHLNKNGMICLEHGNTQAEAVRVMLQQAGFVGIKTVRDLSGHERVTIGERKTILD